MGDCDHWWKAISLGFKSPYFQEPQDGKGQIKPKYYQVEECKRCGNLRIRDIEQDCYLKVNLQPTSEN